MYGIVLYMEWGSDSKRFLGAHILMLMHLNILKN